MAFCKESLLTLLGCGCVVREENNKENKQHPGNSSYQMFSLSCIFTKIRSSNYLIENSSKNYTFSQNVSFVLSTNNNHKFIENEEEEFIIKHLKNLLCSHRSLSRKKDLKEILSSLFFRKIIKLHFEGKKIYFLDFLRRFF